MGSYSRPILAFPCVVWTCVYREQHDSPTAALDRPTLYAGLGFGPGVAAGGNWAALAQTPSDQTPPSATPAPNAAPAGETLKQHDQELDAIRAQQRESADSQAKLRSQITSIGEDRRALNKQLINSATRVRGVEGKIEATRLRLHALDERKRSSSNHSKSGAT